MSGQKLTPGLVIAAHGRQYLVELDDGTTRLCFPRGKKSELACGDRVEIGDAGDGRGVVEKIAERTSLLYRSNEFRQKLIAANVTQIVIVVATEPSFSDELVTRCLVAADSQGIRPLIVLNKCDLEARLPAARAALSIYRRLGYPVLELSARAAEGASGSTSGSAPENASGSVPGDAPEVASENVQGRASAESLRPFLHGQTSVLVGQSGMGKSTLLNALIPEANAATREISAALDTGKHTTTHARLHRLDAGSALIDSPGLQSFGLHHLDITALEAAFPEFQPLLGHCRFRDCRHDREPGCAFTAALARGDIAPRRFACYRTLRGESAGKA